LEAARAVRRHPEIPPRDLAAEGRALQVEKARGTLQIGQGIGVGLNQAVELGPGGQLEAQDLKELRIMPLQDAEGVGHITAEVVDHLGARTRCPAQENAAHAHERFGIGGVCGMASMRAQMRLARLRLPPIHGAMGRVGATGVNWNFMRIEPYGPARKGGVAMSFVLVDGGL
jgi:hypothetical protein